MSKSNESLQSELTQIKAENERLAEMCRWMLRAQSRSGDHERKVNDHREAMPQTVELLQNKGFLTAYTDLMDSYQRGVLNSQPAEAEIRENYYLKSQVLQELLLKLTNQVKTVQMADDATAKLKAVQ